MAQAIGDPEELERFAHSLQQFIDSLNDAVGNLNGAFSLLGDTWQDEKRARFEEDYNALLQQLHQFNANAEEQVPYLAALASRLRDYLQSKRRLTAALRAEHFDDSTARDAADSERGIERDDADRNDRDFHRFVLP